MSSIFLAASSGVGLDSRISDGNLGATPTVHFSTSNHRAGVLNSNCTPTPVNPANPREVVWALTQDATGSRTVNWSNFPFESGGTEPVVNTVPNSTTVIKMYWDGTNYRLYSSWS